MLSSLSVDGTGERARNHAQDLGTRPAGPWQTTRPALRISHSRTRQPTLRRHLRQRQRLDLSRPELIAESAPEPTHHTTNPVHIDITPNHGIDTAIADILELGGTVKKAPGIYPRPRSYPNSRPVIDWAVVQDPFGNEFCLVDDLTEEQSDAAIDAAERGATTDHEFRAAAGLTRT